MKKILFLLSALFIFTFYTKAQCTSNSLVTSLGLPGIYPIGSMSIPGIPSNIPIGINNGQVNIPYDETLTLVILEDTTLDIAFLLDMIDPSIVPLMNTFNISTTMSVNVNQVTYDISGLPNNLNYSCDMSNCEYLPGSDGCIKINGTPIQAGSFPIDVNMIINIQIPSIPNPIPGSAPIFSGMGIDIPSFPGQSYNLLINGATNINNTESEINIYLDPTSNIIYIRLDREKDVQIFNSLGKNILSYTQKENIKLCKSPLVSGLYIIQTSDNTGINRKKLIVH